MKARITQSLVPAFLVAAIGIVTFNTWLALRAVRTLNQSQIWVAHTWQVLNAIERITGSLKDAESGDRGYLLTGDEEYLAPYMQARNELPSELDNLQQLTSDNPQQRPRIDEMRAVITARLRLLQEGIAERDQGAASGIRALVLTGTGKAEMDHLRAIAGSMQNAEARLLAERTRTAELNSQEARGTIIFAGVLDLLLIVITFRYFAKERQMRALADANAEEIRLLNADLEERVRLRTIELETTNRELEAFSFSVSHDLRAPLRTVDGFSLALEEDYGDRLDADGRDFIRRIREGVQRMGQLIDTLLQLSRITRAELNSEPFDISGLATAVAEQLRVDNPSRNLRFLIQPGLQVDADPRMVRVALENLLGNSVKFTANVPHAVIEFGQEPTGEFYVRDNGAGFDMQYAGKLFNAFQRLHGDKDFKGSGIGLATVARVVHRHHGSIRGEAAVGSGATFRFTLG